MLLDIIEVRGITFDVVGAEDSLEKQEVIEVLVLP
jgi:hypothetical protein